MAGANAAASFSTGSMYSLPCCARAATAPLARRGRARRDARGAAAGAEPRSWAAQLAIGAAAAMAICDGLCEAWISAQTMAGRASKRVAVGDRRWRAGRAL